MRRLYFLVCIIFIITGIQTRAQDQYEVITSHPRIVLTKEAELTLQFLFLESEDANKIKASLRKNADLFVNEKPISSDFIKESVKKNSLNQTFYKITTLGMAYRLFEEDVYAQKMTEYLVAISSLPDWYPTDLAITSQLTTMTALGYDWLYYSLNRENRELIRNSIVQKGLNPGLAALSGKEESTDYYSENQDKMLMTSCGFVLGSLSVADDFPAINKKVIYRFLLNNQQTLEKFTFESFMEKYGDDWDITANYLAMTMASLNVSLGHDFKISALENVKAFSNDYLSYLESDVDSKDEKSNYVLNPALLWFSKLNSNTKANDFYLESVKKYHLKSGEKTQLNYLCLLWMI